MKYAILAIAILLSGCTTYNDSHDIVYSPTDIIGNGNIPQNLPTNNNWKWNKRNQNTQSQDNTPLYMRHRSIYNQY